MIDSSNTEWWALLIHQKHRFDKIHSFPHCLNVHCERLLPSFVILCKYRGIKQYIRQVRFDRYAYRSLTKISEIVLMDVMMECAIVIIYNIVWMSSFPFFSIWIFIHFYIECSFYCSHPIKYCSFEWNKCNGQNTFSRYITCQYKSKHYIFMKVHEIFFVNSIETYTFEI